MVTLAHGLIGIGVVASLVGMNGFVDTRKVDRRFKTGYKNNAPDLRNFGRSGKILLCGIGIFVFGLALNHFLDSDLAPARTTAVQDATDQDSRPVPAQDATNTSPDTTASASNLHLPVPPQPSTRSAGIETASQESPSPKTDELASPPEVSPSTPIFPTSFDCSKASYGDESTICHDPGLAAMDRRLSELYTAALNRAADQDALTQSEAAWVTTRHQCGSDLDCLRHAYGERIGRFTGSLGSQPVTQADTQ